MTEIPRNHSSKEQLPDPTNGEVLLPAHAENTPAMARQEATVNHDAAAEKQRLAAAEAAVESTTANQINPLERLRAEQAAESRAPTPRVIDRELKKVGLRQELKQVRRKLPARQRALSRVVHQPAVRAVSDAASQSLSRPSGLLGGGLVAFIGSLGYMYLTKHDKAHYNYFVFLALFATGFVVGLILELVVYVSTTSARRHHD
jgi:hypothetical protein